MEEQSFGPPCPCKERSQGQKNEEIVKIFQLKLLVQEQLLII